MAWRNREDIACWFFSDGEITLSSHLAWYTRVTADPTQAYYAIDALTSKGQPEPLVEPVLVGVVGLANIDLDSRTAEFGRFMLGHPGYLGAGYAREAAYLLCDHAFADLGLQRLWAEVIPENARALTLYESIGFQAEAMLKGHVHKGGRDIDIQRVAVTAAAFRDGDPELRRSLGLAPR